VGLASDWEEVFGTFGVDVFRDGLGGGCQERNEWVLVGVFLFVYFSFRFGFRFVTGPLGGHYV
jgi:hypothetical protein